MTSETMRFGIDVSVLDESRIVQTMWSEAGGIRGELIRQMLDTAETQIRESLIKMGWTPPSTIRTPAPAGELAALAEAWVEAAEYHQQLAREMPGILDERKLGLACADAMERKEIARADFHTALSTHLAEVRAAIGPLRALHMAQVAAWPASEQWDDRCSIMVDWPVVCRIAALAKKLEG